MTVSAVVSVSASEAVAVNVIDEPKPAESGEVDIAVNDGRWFTLNGEPLSPVPCDDDEHREFALLSQTKAYQALLSLSPVKVV